MRVQCRCKYSSRSLSHLLMSFLLPMRIYASSRPLTLPVTKCHTERTHSPSLKRDIINEWPLSSSPKCSCKFSFRSRHRFTSYQVHWISMVVVVDALCLLLFSGCRCVLQKQSKRKLNVQVFLFTNVGYKAVNIIRRENFVVLLFFVL